MVRKLDNERISALNEQSDLPSEDHLKASSTLHSIYSQKLHYVNLHSGLGKEVQENEEKIKRFENELMEKTNNDIVIQSYFLENNCHAQIKDFTYCEKHTANIIEDVLSRDVANQELIIKSFGFAYRTYNVLNAQGLLSEDMDTKYKALIQKIEGKKSVVWKDAIESPKIDKMKELVNLTKLPIYMTANHTPADKRNLVSVLDITPNNMVHRQKMTPFTSMSPNVQLGNTVTKLKPHLGNTVTKSIRSVAFVSPSSRLFPVKKEKENFGNSYSSYSYNRRTPDRRTTTFGPSTSPWSNRNYSSISKNLRSNPIVTPHRTFYGNNNASTSGNFSMQTRSKANNNTNTPFSHNPNFRFNPRR